ncbi:MAG: N-acetylmuramoyl-L-alanine amidase [Thermoanaerobacterium sp.]|uniref:N-acetylmuramoyl-L-alanine amidase family protein n=1 Tax=Thermoanaerobacterium thermosaccharolyticum TaxID=1517 RepID=UPI0024ABC4FB|nr:N-acetylmuramoyl-L-alanine amidase [Thermoanaerobacterium sp.]MDK2805561.1 N-acetylmuramoyl-L-alanine amidase [Thermoanaerobacterium sp.]WHE07901.1 N-acetylmuramoyl-L-alanine amidase [Thermoanaerobacterium thermosaccharolyticum]
MKKISTSDSLKKFNYIYCTISVVLLSTILLFISNTLIAFSTTNELKGKTILIDPGHGGIDGGTSSGNLLEKNINLEASMILKSKLISHGAKVIMTRDKDVSLENLCNDNDYRHRRDLKARVTMINDNKIDIYLSIHVNAVSNAPYVKGPMVFYSNTNENSKSLAEYIQESLNVAAGVNRNPNIADYFLLTNAKKTGVLVELGFITNINDKNLLQSKEYLSKLSDAIIDGLEKYFKNK